MQFLKRTFLAQIFFCAVIFTGVAFAQDNATFPRYPSLSPDGQRIAFCYVGDIWQVDVAGGCAVRLTTDPIYEHSPQWSPDGQWIAFNARREGYEDIYIIPATGGQSQRLTFMDAGSKICSWSPTSDAVYFTSRRDHVYPDYPLLYRIPLAGGTPLPLMDGYCHDAVVSDDGSEILYVLNGMAWWRKGYRGSKSAEVWRYNFNQKSHTAITDTIKKIDGEAFRHPSSEFPQYGKDGEIFLISDRSGSRNIWKRGISGNWSQLTHFTQDDVRFLKISANKEILTFEQGLEIYTLKPGEEPRKVNIIAPYDNLELFPERTQFTNSAKRVTFGPNDRQLFVEVRGEVFAGRIVDEKDEAARKDARCLTGDTPFSDGDFALSPGGDSLVFVSDREGNRDLYLIFSDDPATTELTEAKSLKLERLTTDPGEDHRPRWSPDGKKIGFIRGNGNLYALDLKSKKERLILPGWSMNRYTWSPDGKWIAYAREDNDYNSDVFVMPSEGGASVNISRHPDEDSNPVWSADGEKLGFSSRRRENNWDIYFVFLKLEDHQKYYSDRAEERFLKGAPSKEDDKKDEKKESKEDKADKKDEVVVEIDTTDIFRRIRTVTSLLGEENHFDISPDGESFIFTSDIDGERDLYSIKWNGKDQKRLTNGGKSPKWFAYSSDGKKIYFLDKGGRANSISADGGGSKDYPFKAYVTIDRIAERMQKFDETWRGLNNEYYDPDFHGVDWQAMRDKYRNWAPYASTENDFHTIMNIMIGELNSSHSGYNSPRGGKDHRVGRLCLDFNQKYTGDGLQITHVVPWGPCDRGNVHLQSGDILLAIDGALIYPTTNINKLLDEKSYQAVELIIKSGKKETSHVVRPMGRSLAGRLRYDEWVQNRRAAVESLSGGKLGYLHIKGMGDPSLSKFEAELFSRGQGKDALVVDVRFNGGGYITDYLLAMLQVKRHATTFPRDGGPGYPQSRLPLYSWVKPIIVLCNEYSFSNAEIFSHAIQTLERGRLVGVPTAGGVISTGWNGLMDGSSYRVPLRGWYKGNVEERDPARNEENNGAVPDIIVPMAPDWLDADEDIQLQTAVDELLKTIGK